MKEIKINSMRSEVGEAIGTLSGMVTYGMDSFDGLSALAGQEEVTALKFFENKRHKGLLLGEFLLVFGIDLTLEAFIEKIRALDSVTFLYHFFSEMFPKAVVEKCLQDPNHLKKYMKEHGYDDLEDSQVLMACVGQIDEIKAYIANGLGLAHRWNQLKEPIVTEAMEGFIETTANKLKKVAPLEYAQQLMGKKFRRISDYSTYLFVPTYYGGVNCIRFFDEKTLIVLDRVGPSWDSVSSESLAKAMKVLSDSTRLEIMAYIMDRPSYGIELSERFGVSRPTISHHLELMNSIGLVHMERVKNTKYYSLNKRRYEALMRELREFILKD